MSTVSLLMIGLSLLGGMLVVLASMGTPKMSREDERKLALSLEEERRREETVRALERRAMEKLTRWEQPKPSEPPPPTGRRDAYRRRTASANWWRKAAPRRTSPRRTA